jgi:hypothetical protein
MKTTQFIIQIKIGDEWEDWGSYKSEESAKERHWAYLVDMVDPANIPFIKSCRRIIKRETETTETVIE